MKNQYASRLERKKRQEICNASKEGFDFAMQVIVVALNNLFGFGKERIEQLEKELNRLMEEEFGTDIEAASYGLARRIRQIRGGKEEERKK